MTTETGLEREIESWAKSAVAHALRPGDFGSGNDALVVAVNSADAHGAVAHLLDHLREECEQCISGIVLPRFWDGFQRRTLEDQQSAVLLVIDLAQTTERLWKLLDQIVTLVGLLQTARTDRERLRLKTVCGVFLRKVSALLCKEVRKRGLIDSLKAFYVDSLAQMSHHSEEGMETLLEQVTDAVRRVSAAWRFLQIGDLADEAAATAVGLHLQEHLVQSVEAASTGTILNETLQYGETVPFQFLGLVQGSGEALMDWRLRLRQLVYDAVGKIRASSLFDLVIDYPESTPALEDLRECLRHTGAYADLVEVFENAICSRLLHPGAATADIIQHYVSTIRALRHIDVSGAVLDAVSGPLRSYLRTRKDAIRCIVTMLTGDGTEVESVDFLTELAAEGQAGGGYVADRDLEGPDADELALLEMERWEPAPLEIMPLRSTTTPQDGDIISMLVNVYGTKDLFISEYRAMLSERLLAKTNFDCDRELRTLELLKVRFGEAALNAPEIMLRDVADSKRINASVRTVSNNATPLKHKRNLVSLDGFDVTILSELFWPSLPCEECILPQRVTAMMETFGAKYHALKTPRALRWKPGLGTATLSLTIGSSEIEFSVSPLHAAILLEFEEQSDWGSSELAEAVGVSNDVLRRKIVFWINQGVIKEVRLDNHPGGVLYRRNEELQRPLGAAADHEPGMDVEDDMGAGKANAMTQFEPFVIGMLTNFDALPLDRIHNMLKMFVTDPPYDRSLDQLSAFMAQLTTEDKVVLEGGMYKRR